MHVFTFLNDPEIYREDKKGKCYVIMICPVWQAQPWYPVLLEMVCENPWLLHPSNDLLMSPLTGIRNTSILRLEIVRQNFRKRSFSSPLVELLVAGSRVSTFSTYESAWGIRADWCYQRGEDPLSTTLLFVLKFLTNLHGAGKSYSTINVHLSML